MKTVEELVEEFNNLFEEISEVAEEDNYISPETDYCEDLDFYLDNYDKDFLKQFCDKVGNKEDFWAPNMLYSFVSYILDNKEPCFNCGGFSPVLAVAVFVAAFGKIDNFDVAFTHDKWEARGDYSFPKRLAIKWIKSKKHFKIYMKKVEAFGD